MSLASLTFLNLGWWWFILLVALILAPLAWVAWKPLGPMSSQSWLPLCFRVLGILFILLFLLEPHWTSERAAKGANIVAIIADNSQGLQLREIGSEKTRGEELAEHLTGIDSGWLAELSDTFQIRPYQFDRDLRRIPDFTHLNFQGDRSNLGLSLANLIDRFQGLPLAGIVVLTDGNATDLEEDLAELPDLPPVYPVVVGNPGQMPDVSIDRIELHQTAFDDAPVTLTADVVSRGGFRRPVEVRVRSLNTESLLEQSEDTRHLPEPVRVSPRTSGKPQSINFRWRPLQTGIQFYEVVAELVEETNFTEVLTSPDEATDLNNKRLFMIDQGQEEYRVLYVSGRPNWEFKFLNRALAEDHQLSLVGLIRVARREPKFEFKGRSGESSNPLYRGFGREDETEHYDQPVLVRINTRDQDELIAGFPTTAEVLFEYDAVILDDVEAEFFTFNQLTLLRRFASERGGGLLMLGGADSLENGDYAETPLASALPVYLNRKPATPPGTDLQWQLTREGWVEPWVRVRPLESEEKQRLNAMPPFKVLNPLTSIKPGAQVLAEVVDRSGNSYPGLVAQPFGSGRVACLAVGDLWRWGLKGPEEQVDLARFWRQLARWLVTDNLQQVELQTTRSGETMQLKVLARDKSYQPVDLAQARVTIRRVAKLYSETEDESGFEEVTVYAEPVSDMPGHFAIEFMSRDAGAYLASVEVTDTEGAVLGTAEAGWVLDSAAEEFRSLEPNRVLLENLAIKTGGQVLGYSQLGQLTELLSRNPAPVTEIFSSPLWHKSWWFLAILTCFLFEWAIRRLRGLP
ncbi:MAG: glutamine amidotransferase [Verrucomicrobia bacterium]|nr:glutamine amidotransferase [Verrucomicrobiota bacterium]